MARRSARLAFAGIVLGAGMAHADDFQKVCAGLATGSGALAVSEAQFIPAGAIDLVGPVPAKAEAPAHCLVRGALNARTGIDGKPYAIGYEIRLPADWNGKFVFQGGGGTDGVLRTATGAISGAAPKANALMAGYAVAATDAGHRDEPGPVGAYMFGLDPQARIDKGYASILAVADAARALIAKNYGKPQRRSYFMGCSNGGRQAMAATQRYPDMFDGVIAGAPAWRVPLAAIDTIGGTQALAAIAPKIGEGAPDIGAALSKQDLDLIAAGVLESCDAADGVKDGMVNNVAACRFDPAALACKEGQTEACLTSFKVTAVKAMFEGTKKPDGTLVYSKWPYDPGIATPGWTAWRLGTPGKSPPDARNITLIPGSVAYYFTTPPEKVQDLRPTLLASISRATCQRFTRRPHLSRSPAGISKPHRQPMSPGSRTRRQDAFLSRHR